MGRVCEPRQPRPRSSGTAGMSDEDCQRAIEGRAALHRGAARCVQRQGALDDMRADDIDHVGALSHPAPGIQAYKDVGFATRSAVRTTTGCPTT